MFYILTAFLSIGLGFWLGKKKYFGGDYLDGYMQGFLDCGQKNILFLESLPQKVKEKYGLKINK